MVSLLPHAWGKSIGTHGSRFCTTAFKIPCKYIEEAFHFWLPYLRILHCWYLGYYLPWWAYEKTASIQEYIRLPHGHVHGGLCWWLTDVGGPSHCGQHQSHDNLAEGLEKPHSGSEHKLLLQRTYIQVAHKCLYLQTGNLMPLCNHHRHLQTWHTHMQKHTHTNTHTHK